MAPILKQKQKERGVGRQQAAGKDPRTGHGDKNKDCSGDHQQLTPTRPPITVFFAFPKPHHQDFASHIILHKN